MVALTGLRDVAGWDGLYVQRTWAGLQCLSWMLELWMLGLDRMGWGGGDWFGLDASVWRLSVTFFEGQKMMGWGCGVHQRAWDTFLGYLCELIQSSSRFSFSGLRRGMILGWLLQWKNIWIGELQSHRIRYRQ